MAGAKDVSATDYGSTPHTGDKYLHRKGSVHHCDRQGCWWLSTPQTGKSPVTDHMSEGSLFEVLGSILIIVSIIICLFSCVVVVT